jgi:glycosyltransferase involved in cell wall biosynthesis
MRVLVWQWGRRGGAPRFAAALADGLRMNPGTDVLLSLSTGAEILQSRQPPVCDLPFRTYSNLWGYIFRVAQAPLVIRWLMRHLKALGPDVAICALPGLLDLLMVAALRLCRIPLVVIVHDGDSHLGDGLPLQMFLQRRLIHCASAVVALSHYVGGRLLAQRLVKPDQLIVLSHPPFVLGPKPPPPCEHGGPLRLLCFGRLLSYKGLGLLASAMQQVGPDGRWQLRVVGSGMESPELDRLRAVPGVTVENRWVPEDEIGDLIAWADAMLLPYRESSQSGIGPAAIAAGRLVVATRVGGLEEQLGHEALATLCEPDVASIAAAVRKLVDACPVCQPPPHKEPRLAWRDMAKLLLEQLPVAK